MVAQNISVFAEAMQTDSGESCKMNERYLIFSKITKQSFLKKYLTIYKDISTVHRRSEQKKTRIGREMAHPKAY